MTGMTGYVEKPKLGTIPEVSFDQGSQSSLVSPTDKGKGSKRKGLKKKFVFSRDSQKCHREGPDGPLMSSFLNGHYGQKELYPSKTGIYISPGLNRAYARPAVEILMGVLIFIAGLVVLCVGFSIWGSAHDMYVIYTGIGSCVAGLLFMLLGCCIRMSREKPPVKKRKPGKRGKKKEEDEKSIVNHEVTQDAHTP